MPRKPKAERTLSMLTSLRHLPAECKAPEALSVHVLQQIYPRGLLEGILTACQRREKRQRCLSLLVVLMVVIIMNWYPRRSQRSVLQTLARGTRELWPVEPFPIASASSLAERRSQLGSEPMRLLFHAACVPLATPETRGAFRLGYRVMAIDGTWQNVADTPANAEAFGRFQSGKYQSPFPQVRCVLLVECGTHAIVDVEVAGCRVAEREGARTLLRSISPQMLVTLDTGFYGAPFWEALTQKGAAVLGRVPSHALKRSERVLPDGTTLATMRSREAGRSIAVPVRVISSQITDERVGKPETLYRLATTLLDPVAAPAEKLIELYHERWEAELTVDELKNHQHLSLRPLRSLTPDGVLQELYGWFLAHYALRSLIHRSAQQAALDPDRLSFTRARELVDEATFSFALLPPSEHPRLLQRLLTDLRTPPLPERRLRLNARVIKQRFSKFSRKRDQHRRAPHLKGFSFLDVIRLL
jgi:hypothetical protein